MNETARKLSIGYSPCPNDTFIFYALMHGRISLPDISFAKELLADVETLNQWALEGRLDVTKLSFHALGHVLDEYVLLNSGSALGRGCGPLLVTRKKFGMSTVSDKTIALPGKMTTATMLFRLFAPECNKLVFMPFHEIMPAIKNGAVDAGIIIHESRFTYENYGLQLVQDLGQWWETETGYPVPLGGIVARRALGPKTIAAIDRAIAFSIRWAFENPGACRAYINEHAQELARNVIDDHIGLYVNSFSENLGEEGVLAVREFLNRGNETGIFKLKGDLTEIL